MQPIYRNICKCFVCLAGLSASQGAASALCLISCGPPEVDVRGCFETILMIESRGVPTAIQKYRYTGGKEVEVDGINYFHALVDATVTSATQSSPLKGFVVRFKKTNNGWECY